MMDIICVKPCWSSIKDIIQVGVAVLALVLAFLTYLKAKATLFQPKRAEAIKKQTEIIDAFFGYINAYGRSVDNALDYMNIVRFNIEIRLRDYDLIEDEFLEVMRKEHEDKIANWLQLYNGTTSGLQYMIGNIEEYDYFIEKEGKQVDIAIPFQMKTIVLTKRFVGFYDQLAQLTNSPFVPKEIQDVANELGNQVIHNLQNELVNVFSLKFANFRKTYLSGNIDDAVTLKQNVWRDFDAKKQSHAELLSRLIKEVRKYYLIDKKW